MFRKYHYLNTELNKAAKCYCGLINGEIVVFCAVLHMPHPKKKIKRVHRLVVLPDYQGISIGSRFLTEIAKQYKHIDFNITTSSKNLCNSLKQNIQWSLFFKGKWQPQTNKELNKTSSSDRIIYSFRYKKVN